MISLKFELNTKIRKYQLHIIRLLFWQTFVKSLTFGFGIGLALTWSTALGRFPIAPSFHGFFLLYVFTISLVFAGSYLIYWKPNSFRICRYLDQKQQGQDQVTTAYQLEGNSPVEQYIQKTALQLFPDKLPKWDPSYTFLASLLLIFYLFSPPLQKTIREQLHLRQQNSISENKTLSPRKKIQPKKNKSNPSNKSKEEKNTPEKEGQSKSSKKETPPKIEIKMPKKSETPQEKQKKKEPAKKELKPNHPKKKKTIPPKKEPCPKPDLPDKTKKESEKKQQEKKKKNSKENPKTPAKQQPKPEKKKEKEKKKPGEDQKQPNKGDSANKGPKGNQPPKFKKPEKIGFVKKEVNPLFSEKFFRKKTVKDFIKAGQVEVDAQVLEIFPGAETLYLQEGFPEYFQDLIRAYWNILEKEPVKLTEER